MHLIHSTAIKVPFCWVMCGHRLGSRWHFHSNIFPVRNGQYIVQCCIIITDSMGIIWVSRCVMDPLMGIKSRQKFKVQTSSNGLEIWKTNSLCIILSMNRHLLPPKKKRTNKWRKSLFDVFCLWCEWQHNIVKKCSWAHLLMSLQFFWTLQGKCSAQIDCKSGQFSWIKNSMKSAT